MICLPRETNFRFLHLARGLEGFIMKGEMGRWEERLADVLAGIERYVRAIPRTPEQRLNLSVLVGFLVRTLAPRGGSAPSLIDAVRNLPPPDGLSERERAVYEVEKLVVLIGAGLVHERDVEKELVEKIEKAYDCGAEVGLHIGRKIALSQFSSTVDRVPVPWEPAVAVLYKKVGWEKSKGAVDIFSPEPPSGISAQAWKRFLEAVDEGIRDWDELSIGLPLPPYTPLVKGTTVTLPVFHYSKAGTRVSHDDVVAEIGEHSVRFTKSPAQRALAGVEHQQMREEEELSP